MERKQQEDQSFYHEGDSRAILFIHGFTEGTINSRILAEQFNRKYNFTTYGITLSGHSTSPDELEKYTVDIWRKESEVALRKLISLGKRNIVIFGFSLGGLFGLELAARYPRYVLANVCIEPPIKFRFQRILRLIIEVISPYKRYWRKKSHFLLHRKHAETIKRNGSYDRIPLRNAQDILEYIETDLSAALTHVRSDILIIQGKNIFFHGEKISKEIMNLFTSNKKKLVHCDSRFHLSTINPKQIFDLSCKFILEAT